jgi:hypothetical protein
MRVRIRLINTILTGIYLDKVEKYSITNQKITIEPSIHDTSSATLSLLIQQVNFLSASKIDPPFFPENPCFHRYLYQALPKRRAPVFNRLHSWKTPGTVKVKPRYILNDIGYSP